MRVNISNKIGISTTYKLQLIIFQEVNNQIEVNSTNFNNTNAVENADSNNNNTDKSSKAANETEDDTKIEDDKNN